MKKILFVVICLLYGVAYGQVCADEDTVRSNAVTLITANTARVNGTVAHFSGAPTSLQLRYVRVGQTDTATSSSVPTTALRNLTGLQAATQYYYYYKTICGSGSVSQTIGAYTFTTLANTVLYAPERPTVFNHLKVDSSFIVPEGDTVVGREPSTRAQIRYKTSDNTFYGYYTDCTCWRALAIDSSGIIGLLDGKVDSVTVSGDSLFYWKVGVSYGYILPSVATVWHTTGNTGIDTSTDFIGTTDNVDFPIKTNDVRRFTVNTSGAWGIGATPDYGTSGYVYKSAGSAAAPTWSAHTFQDAITAGSTLTAGNVINGGGFDFEFGTMGNFTIESTNGSIEFTDLLQNSIDLSGSIGINIKPYTGLLIIDTLINNTAQNQLIGWTSTAGADRGEVGYVTLSGLTLSGGVLTNPNPTPGANTALSNLASVAINTSLISDANNTDDLGSNTIGWRYGYISSGIGIGSGFTTPSAALDIRAADLFLTSSSVDQRFIIGESLVSATDVYAISWNRTDNQLVFNEGGAPVSMRLEGDANANLFFADATNDRIGIGDATPASLFTVGSGDLFQVNTSGDMVKIKNVTYSWPAANASGVLTNNGSGTLSWTAAFALTNGVGTTANGTAVDLGGTVNSNVAIDEDGGNDISFDIGRNTAFSDIRMGALNFTFNGGPVQMNNYGAGAATFDASGNITSVSDMRLKNLQGMYEVGLKQLMQINPIVYKWNEKSKLETKHDYIGFSAQNVRDALGENAIGINKDGYYSLQDRAILAAMVNSIKELKELNDKQQEEINNLKSDIRNIKKQ